MRLYVSRRLKGMVPRKEVREEVNDIRGTWSELRDLDRIEKFERATLLFLPWKYPGTEADCGAVLVIKRGDRKVGPILFFNVYENGESDSESSKHLILLHPISKNSLKRLPGLNKVFPKRYRKYLPVYG